MNIFFLERTVPSINPCSDVNRLIKRAFLMSTGYPMYDANHNNKCSCTINRNSNVTIKFHDTRYLEEERSECPIKFESTFDTRCGNVLQKIPFIHISKPLPDKTHFNITKDDKVSKMWFWVEISCKYAFTCMYKFLVYWIFL